MIGDLLRALVRLGEPAGLVWIGLLALAVRPFLRPPRRPDWLPISLFIVWSLATCTTLPTRLIAALEAPWQSITLTSLPACDAIVLLGGGANPSPTEPAGVELREGGDRLATALLAARRFPDLPVVFGGGSYRHNGAEHGAADGLRDWFTHSTAFPQPAYSLGLCSDTHDEAILTANLCANQSWHHILLVTSAYHMTRSQATFEKVGLQVTCLPCNFYHPALAEKQGLSRWLHLPGIAGLTHFSYWFHEVVGLQVYRLRGWAD